MQKRFRAILTELRHHAPFTLIGAATGIICMLLFRHAGARTSHDLFLVFHPGHVVLSAIVTASLFRLHDKSAGLLKIVLIGYFGSIGVATLSDCILPFFGESILGVAVPTHAAAHVHKHESPAHVEDSGQPADTYHHEAATDHNDSGFAAEATVHDEHDDDRIAEPSSFRDRLHLGFIEDWYVVNPAAFLGIAIAYFWPRTKFPHAGHVLVSTWASSFHILMNTHRELTGTLLLGAFIVLFIAVWVPCCVSDIIFPMLFVKSAPLCTHHPHEKEAHA